MKLRKVYTVVCALLVAAAVAISAPASAQGLIGDTITSCFDNILSCPGDQHWDSGTAVVADPGIEFTGIGTVAANDLWTADFSGPTGSRLTITGCCTPGGLGVGQGVYKFRFEDLDFGGGQAITNVIVDPASVLPLLVPISFTSNSITIALDRFILRNAPKSLIVDIVTVPPAVALMIDEDAINNGTNCSDAGSGEGGGCVSRDPVGPEKVADIAALVEAAAPRPGRRGSYKKRISN